MDGHHGRAICAVYATKLHLHHEPREAVNEENAEPKLDEVPDISESASDSSSEDVTVRLESEEEPETAKE